MLGLPPTIAPTEASWSTMALVGLAVTLWGLWDAYGDRRALRDSGKNGARRVVALGNIRREWARTYVLLCFLALGVYQMARPPVLAAQPVTRGGIALTLALVLAALVIVVESVLDRRERVNLRVYIDAELDRTALARAEGREAGAAAARREDAARKLADELATATRVKAEALALAILAEAEAAASPREVVVVDQAKPITVQVTPGGD